MKPIKFTSHQFQILSFSCALLAAGAFTAKAQDTWSASGASANWSLAGNWSGGLPVTGEALIFGADSSSGAALTDNLTTGTAWVIPSITFNSSAPAYTISPSGTGNGFTLGTATAGTAITQGSANAQTIGDRITLAAASQSISLTGGNLILTNVIAGTGGGLTLNGVSGTVLTLGVSTTSPAETFTGPTVVNGGTLSLWGPNAAASALSSSSSVTIDNGGTILVNADNAFQGQPSTAGPVIINAGGVLTGLSTADSGAGPSCHIPGLLTLNGGTLANGGTGAQGAYGTWDLFGGVTVPGMSTTTSTISALDVIPCQSGGTHFNITNGGTPSGIDLDVQGTLVAGTSQADTGIIMQGNGTMRFDGANTYTGPTVIGAGGTLIINATQTLSGLFSGTGALKVNAGTLTVNSGGSVGALSLASGAAFAVNVTASDSQFIASSLTSSASSITLTFSAPFSSTSAPLQINGPVNFAVAPVITLAGSAANYAGQYPIIKYTGTLTGLPTFNVTMAGLTGASLVNNAANKSIDLLIPAADGNELAWGTGSANWNFSDPDWFNGSGLAAYADGMLVNFLDTQSGASPITVTITVPAVTPSGVIFDNSAKNYTLTGTGGIVGAGNLTFEGLGTVTINNTNNNTGVDAVNAGTLMLDFNALGNNSASWQTGQQSNNILGAGSSLSLGGGTLDLNESSTLTNTQTFTGTTFVSGNSQVELTGSGANFAQINLGGLTDDVGATVVFNGSATIGSGGSSVAAIGTINTTSSGSGGSGLFGGNGTTTGDYATVGLYDWAASTSDPVSGYDIVGGSQVSGFYTAFGTGNNTLTGNVDFTGATAGSHNTDNVGSIRFNTAGGCVWSPTGIVTTGGVLVTPNVGAANVTIAGVSGDFEPSRGGASSTVFFQNNVLGFLIGNTASFFNNAKSGNGILILAGLGTMKFNYTSTYSGPTYINGNAVAYITGNDFGAPATAATVYLNGGTVMAAATFSLDNGGSSSAHPFVLGANGGGFAAANGFVMTIDGLVSGTGPLTIGIPASSANGNVAGLLPGTGSGTANTTPVYATGTVSLTDTANTYSGGTILDSGILTDANGALGTGPVTFNGGAFQWLTTTPDISLSGTTISAGGGTMDVNGHNISLADGIAGSGALTIASTAGAGTLNLNGANTYSGSATINSGATLAGGGSFAGSVTALSGSTFALSGSVSGSLTLNSGATVMLTASGAAQSVGSAAFNNNMTTVYLPSALTSGNTYTILTSSTPITGTLVAQNPLAIGPGYSGAQVYTLGVSGNNVTLTVAAAAEAATWTGSGNWSVAGNWNPATAPNGAGSSATFGSGSSPVNLNINETVGAITFTNPASYLINGSSTLTLDNSGNGVLVTVNAGSANNIATAVSLNDLTTSQVSSGNSMTYSGKITSTATTKTLTLKGLGTNVLSGANTYGPAVAGTVGTTITGGGTVNLANNSALGTGDVSVTASTIQVGVSGLTLGNNIVLGAGITTVDNNGGLNAALNGAVSGGGSLNVINSVGTGNGVLTLAGGNSYSGATTINPGAVVSVDADTSLGAAPGAPAANSIVFTGGDLLGTGTVALSANRSIGIGSSFVGNTATNTALIDSTGTLSIGGTVAGAGNNGVNNLLVNSMSGTGTVELAGAGAFNGTTTVAKGTLEVGNSLALQSSTVLYNAGNITFDGGLGVTAATFGGFLGSQNLLLENTSGGGVVLTLDGNNSSATYAGRFSDGGSGGGLNKAGSGTLTLTGASAYTGTTTVSAGTLLLTNGGAISGGAATIDGELEISGGSFTASGASTVAAGSTLLITSGSASFPAGLTGPDQDNPFLIQVSGGALTASSLNYGRTAYNSGATLPATGQTTFGVYVNGGTVNITGNYGMSSSPSANSSVTAEIDSGSVTVGGSLTIGLNNGGRWSVMDVNGGTLTVNDTNTGISLGGPDAGKAALLVRNGTATANIITMGGPAANAYAAAATAEIYQTNGTLYLGSGGIVQPQTVNVESIIQLGSGTLGATANWSCSISGDGSTTGFLLGVNSGDTYTIQAADAANVSHNITLSGSLGGVGNLLKTGGGILTLSGTNTWQGTTTVSAGTLALAGDGINTGVLLDPSGTLGVSSVNIIAPGVLDVTGLPDQTLHLADPGLSQESYNPALTGNGVLNGNVFLGAINGTGTNSTLAPGTNATSFGNLTITGNLTNAAGGFIMKVDHPPTGVINDEVTALTITNLAGSTLTVIQGANDLQTGDTFKLFNITGGSYAHFADNLTISLPTAGPVSGTNYVWNTANLDVNGTITLTQGATPSIPMTPTNMIFGVSGRTLNISWPGYLGWSLQSNSINISVPADWFTVPGSSAVTSESITIPTTGSVYFRLYYQAP